MLEHAPPRLRLVRDEPDPAERQAVEERERRVADANRAASRLTAEDARWVLAVRVAESLEGGTAAVLTNESRRRLTRLAQYLGLRPFDANLIIAIVQDGARTGEGALGRSVEARLPMVREPMKTDPAAWRTRVLWTIFWGAAIGTIFTSLIIRWILAP